MPKQWFILHALSGHELKVQKNIASRVQQEEMEDIVGEVLIPSEKVSEVKQGRKTTVNRKFFPGYVLINIELYLEDKAVNAEAWTFIQNTPGVIGFLGGERPAPMSDAEVDSIVNQIEEKKESVAPKVMFEPGEKGEGTSSETACSGRSPSSSLAASSGASVALIAIVPLASAWIRPSR